MTVTENMPDRLAQAGRFDPNGLIVEPDSVYHAKRADHVTSHSLADFARCPLTFHKKRTGAISSPDSSTFAFGRAFHKLVLEGREQFEAEYAVGGPINEKTGNPYGTNTKAFKEWAAKQEKEILSDADAATIERMAISVSDHEEAVALLSGGVAERVARTEIHGVACQSRIDYAADIGAGRIVDLKTCYSLDAFEDQITEYGYVDQLAFYRMMAAATCGAVPGECFLVATEKAEPFRTGVWVIRNESLDAAAKRIDRLVQEVASCQLRGYWPSRFNSIRVWKEAC